MKRSKDRKTGVRWIGGSALALGFLVFGAYLILVGGCGKEVPKDLELRITSPVNGAEVGMQGTVTGEVSDPVVQVQVLIHPMTASQWWVQRPPLAGRDGSWKTTVYFGTKTEGIGEDFEIVAIATRKKLNDGDTIRVSELPTDGVRSEIVTVTRHR